MIQNKIRANYHTHTPRCFHAAGTEEEYVQAAISHGYDILGFADHGPWPYDDGFVSRIRMVCDQLPEYIQAVHSAGEKYSGQIRVHCGLEMEHFPRYTAWLKDAFYEYGLDYLILGNHYDTYEKDSVYFGSCKTKEHVRRYAQMTIAGMETGLFLYVAHPDLFLSGYPEFDDTCAECSRELLRASRDLNVPLEYNLLGIRKSTERPARGVGYPYERFWEMAAEEGCTAVIGIDAHTPAQLYDPELFDLAATYLKALGIKRLETLDEEIKTRYFK